MNSKSIFVTCGATVPFPKLTEAVVSREFVDFISNNYKFNRLVIQYGLGYSDQFQQLMSESYGKGDITYRKINYGYKKQEQEDGKTENEGFYFEYRILEWDFIIIGLEYSNNVQDLISESRLVISHAGTGSILDTLRHSHTATAATANTNSNRTSPSSGSAVGDNIAGVAVPLIVVINDQLMDNHQEQIANKFSERGYLLSCRSNNMVIKELMQSITDLETGKIRLRPFPQSYSGQFVDMLIDLSRH